MENMEIRCPACSSPELSPWPAPRTTCGNCGTEIDAADVMIRLRDVGAGVQTDADGKHYLCTCDDSEACAACYDAADSYVGKVIRDSYGRIWTVEGTDSKDGTPTLDGAGVWTRVYDVEILAGSPAAARELAQCGDCLTVTPIAELRPISHLAERVAAGELMPAGECPAKHDGQICGALAQPLEALSVRGELTD